MRWDERLLALFDDLEQQAEGLALADRDVSVAERSRAEYARVDLAARLHASVGAPVLLSVRGVGNLEVSLVRVGSGWLLADAGRQEWLVRTAALIGAARVSDRAVAESARSIASRLGVGSALRGLADAGLALVVYRVDGSQLVGRIRRAGADFVELDTGPAGERRQGTTPGAAELLVVPFEAISAVRSSD